MVTGLDVAEKIRASGVGRKMFLTTPFIDQALSQVCAFLRQKLWIDNNELTPR
jgi:hypothetical protein